MENKENLQRGYIVLRCITRNVSRCELDSNIAKTCKSFLFGIDLRSEYISKLLIKGFSHLSEFGNVGAMDASFLKKFPNLKRLHFYRSTPYISMIDRIPNTITWLKLGDSFDCDIYPGFLPATIETLIFGWDFDSNIKPNSLPTNLIKLVFGHCYNREIKKDVLPNSLLHLKFGFHFQREIGENTLPDSIEILEFGRDYKQILNENNLPKNLRILTLPQDYPSINNIPKTVRIKFIK